MKVSVPSQPTGELSLRDQLLHECLAMARYALSSGSKVPGNLVQSLEALERRLSLIPALPAQAGDGSPPANKQEAEPPSVLRDQAGQDIQRLTLIHNQLAEIIAPATPRTLLEIEAAKENGLKFIGPVPLVRRMVGVAIVSLTTFIGISLSPQVDGNPEKFSLFLNDGLSLFLNQLFLLSAAGIGASFSALFVAYRYIQDRTFDPLYESSYWIRFVQGLLAGVMLATLIPIESYQDKAGTFQGFGQPLLALLGGFSADLVYRIINRLISAVESLVQGDTRDMVTAREQTSRARLAEQSVQNRLQLAARLTKLQHQLNTSPDPEQLRQELARIQDDLITPGSYETKQESEPPAQAPTKKSEERSSPDSSSA